MRLHPSTGFIMGRIVPQGGAVLLGHKISEGVSCLDPQETLRTTTDNHKTTVGTNSWVAHRNESVFGEEVESFIPERWLVSDENAKKMDRYFLEASFFCLM